MVQKYVCVLSQPASSAVPPAATASTFASAYSSTIPSSVGFTGSAIQSDPTAFASAPTFTAAPNCPTVPDVW
jgi:hypothetical protein